MCCNHKFANDENCTTPHLTEDEIQDYYLLTLRKLLADKEEIITAFEQAKAVAFDLSALTAERNELQNELLVVSELMQQSIYENAHVVLDQAEYKKYYSSLTERFDKKKARLEEVKEVISDKQLRQATIEAFLDELKRLDGVAEFQPALWYGLADCITVYSKDDVRVAFKNGMEKQA
jgi:site-specific DNA recombinase